MENMGKTCISKDRIQYEYAWGRSKLSKHECRKNKTPLGDRHGTKNDIPRNLSAKDRPFSPVLQSVYVRQPNSLRFAQLSVISQFPPPKHLNICEQQHYSRGHVVTPVVEISEKPSRIILLVVVSSTPKIHFAL